MGTDDEQNVTREERITLLYDGYEVRNMAAVLHTRHGDATEPGRTVVLTHTLPFELLGQTAELILSTGESWNVSCTDAKTLVEATD